jgi:hypothetical protein
MAPNPKEADVEPEAIDERDQYLAMIADLDAKVKEARELRKWAQSKIGAYPNRKPGAKDGSIRYGDRSARHNLFATRYAYDMIQRWRYSQRMAGVIFSTSNAKSPASQRGQDDIRGKIIERACKRWKEASVQEVGNKIDRTNADAESRWLSGVQVYIPRSDVWLSKRADLDV